MEINTKKEDLLYGVQMVQKAVIAKNTLPILAGVLFQTKNNVLKIMATDLEIGIKCTIPVTTVKEGSAVIPAKYLIDIIRKLPNVPINIKLDEENNIITIKYNSSEEYSVKEFKLHGFKKEEFPSFPTVEDETEIDFNIPVLVLKELLREILFATGLDENKPVFTGVLFKIEEKNNLALVATDTHRLALRKTSLAECQLQNLTSVIIPGRTLKELARIISNIHSFQSTEDLDQQNELVKIIISNNQALFILKNTILISRLIEGNFPVYDQVIPKGYQSRLKFKTKELLASIERAALLTKTNNQIIKLNTKLLESPNHKQDLLLVTANTEIGAIYEEINIHLEGEPVQIAFNAGYLTDILRTISAEKIYFELSGPLNPGVIKPVTITDGEEYLVLILPVRTA